MWELDLIIPGETLLLRMAMRVSHDENWGNSSTSKGHWGPRPKFSGISLYMCHSGPSSVAFLCTCIYYEPGHTALQVTPLLWSACAHLSFDWLVNWDLHILVSRWTRAARTYVYSRDTGKLVPAKGELCGSFSVFFTAGIVSLLAHIAHQHNTCTHRQPGEEHSVTSLTWLDYLCNSISLSRAVRHRLEKEKNFHLILDTVSRKYDYLRLKATLQDIVCFLIWGFAEAFSVFPKPTNWISAGVWCPGSDIKAT